MSKRWLIVGMLALLTGCGGEQPASSRIEVTVQPSTPPLRTPEPTFPPPPAATEPPAATATSPATAPPATAEPTAPPATAAATAPPAAATPPNVATPTSAAAPTKPTGGSPLYPIVDPTNGHLIGAARDGRWLLPEDAGPLLAGGESYRLYSSTASTGVATSGTPKKGETPPCEWIYDIELPGSTGAELIAVAGPWNALPRLAEELPVDQAVYQEAVAEILRGKGIAEPKVVISKILRADLDGDGVAEVLLNATDLGPNGPQPNIAAGQYSLVALRTVVNGKVETTLIEETIALSGVGFAAPNQFTLRGVADLNGDGRMEVLIDNRYYEGDGISAYEVNGTKVESVLGEGCGA